MRNRLVLCSTVLISAAVMAADPAPKPPADPTPKPPAVLPTPKAVEGASPAQIEALKKEIETLIREREAAAKTPIEDTSNATERANLKSKVISLIDRIELKKSPPVPMPPASSSETTKENPKTYPKIEVAPDVSDSGKLRSVENLFRDGDIEAASRVLNLTDLNKLSREEQLFAEYLKACCLRKLGKTSEAKELYRTIANDKKDNFWTECALSHLQILNATEELEERLKVLRSGKKKQ